jgi:large subunit ribosomal protein L3
MVKGLWGKKIGMTQIFVGHEVVPVTVIDVARWFVTGVKTVERDGYRALQVGLVKDRFAQKTFDMSWIKSPNTYFSFIKEIDVTEDNGDLAVGSPLDFHAHVEVGESLDAFGRTKGCGFAGAVRRHGFAGARASHGATMGNNPGALSFMRSRGRVIKGKKLPGHFGNVNRAVKNLQVVKVESDAQVVLIKGSVPGKSGSLIFLRKSIGR